MNKVEEHLNVRLILNAKKNNIKINHNNVRKDILNVDDIGMCFKQDCSMSNFAKINYFMNVFFEEMKSELRL